MQEQMFHNTPIHILPHNSPSVVEISPYSSLTSGPNNRQILILYHTAAAKFTAIINAQFCETLYTVC